MQTIIRIPIDEAGLPICTSELMEQMSQIINIEPLNRALAGGNNNNGQSQQTITQGQYVQPAKHQEQTIPL